MHIIPLCAPNYVMGLDSSPDGFTALPLDQFFLYRPVSLPPSVCPSLCTDFLYFLSLPHPWTLSFFPALTFFTLFISPLCYSFLPHLYFCHSVCLLAYLYYPSFLFYFSIYISYWFDFSLSPSPFSLMIILITLNFLLFQHLWYLRIGIW